MSKEVNGVQYYVIDNNCIGDGKKFVMIIKIVK